MVATGLRTPTPEALARSVGAGLYGPDMDLAFRAVKALPLVVAAAYLAALVFAPDAVNAATQTLIEAAWPLWLGFVETLVRPVTDSFLT